MVNSLLEVLRSGGTAFGVWCVIDSGLVTEALAREGFDYICIDQQHGLIDDSSALSMMRGLAGSGSTPLVRVPRNDVSTIGKVLDAGALGVVVPMVESGEEASAVVRSCRYAPSGWRSFGPTRASLVMGTSDPRVIEAVAAVVMIETRSGLARAEEIASVPGLDAIYVGPWDLAMSLGVRPGDFNDGTLHSALETVRTACRRHGVAAGIQCDSGSLAEVLAGEGFQMVTVATDAALLRQAAKEEVQRARGVATVASARREGGYV